MTQIEKIRQMSAEELARWLMDEVERGGFSTCFCNRRFCRLYQAQSGEIFDCHEVAKTPDAYCVEAAVAYLESEVEEK